jgi:chitodextrinase
LGIAGRIFQHAARVVRFGALAAIAAVLVVGSRSGAQGQAAPGLVAAYSFDQGTGSALTDSSGNENHGTISGAIWTASGRFGSALSFDGTNDVATVNDASSLDLTAGMTLEAWVFPTGLTQWRPVIVKERSGHAAYALHGNTDTNRPGGEISLPANRDVRGTTTLPVNTWTHLAVTYDGTMLRLYVDGLEVASRAVSGSIVTSTGALRIGGHTNRAEYFQGRIDEVRIYNRALTAGEIQTDLNSPVEGPPPDTTPPSTPTALTASAVSSSRIDLNWTASTDNVGVAGYKIFRDGTQIATVTTTSYQDTGLAPSTTYTYSVVATDAAGNTSPHSTPASATTPVPPDTTPPSTPTGLVAESSSSSQVDLRWTASTDNVGVAGYRVFRDGTQITTVTATSYQDTGLTPSTTYTYPVVAADAAGNTSPHSMPASATTPAPPDTEPPATPTGLTADAVSSSEIDLTWTASTDNIGVTGYKVFRDGTQISMATATSYQDTGLAPATTYTYTVVAVDAAGNTSPHSAPAAATTPAPPDTTAPSTPSGLTALAISSSRIDLSWTASTDDVGVTGYRVYRGGTEIATVSATAYQDMTVQPSTTYSYTVAARDAAGNQSPASDPASATTPSVTCGGGAMASYHTPQCNADGRLIPWHIDAAGPFHHIMDIQATWWLNAPSVNGWPSYLTAAKLNRDYTQVSGAGAVPGSTASMAIEAYLKYFAYTGDVRYLSMAKTIGTYIIQQALTPDTYAVYPRFPWPAGDTGDVTPDGGGHPSNVAGHIMPDKGAMIGVALLRLYEATGDATYRDAAVHIANVLATTAVPGTNSESPWPFRAHGDTGTMVDGPLMGNQVFALRLFDELLRLGIAGNGQYQATRDNVWSWLKNVAIADTSGDTWLHFFEDHGGSEYNPTQFDALETARYLLEKKAALDPDWLSMVSSIIDVVKRRWVVHSGDYTAIGEQEQDLTPYNSHTARYASILAMFAEAGGPAIYRDEAYSAFAYATYSVDVDGFADTYFNQGIAWSTDSFGDWMNHFMDGLGAVPEWAPGNASHLLRSTSVIQSITYADRSVRYVAFDPAGSERLKLNFTPVTVEVAGAPSSSWSWDSARQLLDIGRANGNVVQIIGEGVVLDTTPPSTPADLTATALSSSQIDLTWTAATDDVGVTEYRLERCQGAGCTSFTQVAIPTGTTYRDTGLLAAASYSYRVLAADAAGNLSPYSNTSGATTEAQWSGLVAAYSFSEGSGAGVADASGTGNAGTISGASWIAEGKFGNALSFDGIDDYVTVNDAALLDLTTGMTLEAWVFPTASGGWRTVMLKERLDHLAYALYANTGTDEPSAEIFITSGHDTRGPMLPVDAWSHLAATYDGTTLRLYVDGMEVSSVAVSGDIAASAGVLRVGGNSIWGEYFQGKIDEIRLYNRALTADEIVTDMQTPVGP